MLIWKEPIYKMVDDVKSLKSLCKKIKNNIEKDIPISIDVETTGSAPMSGLDYYNGWLLGIAIACDKEEGYYIPLTHNVGKQLPLKTVTKYLNPLLSSGGLYLGHNFKFDYKFLWKAGIHVFPRIWDTCIAIQLINGDTYKSRALKKILKDYVDIPTHIVKTFTDVAGDDISAKNPLDVYKYAINDTNFTYYMYEALKPIIDREYYNLFYNAEAPLVPVLANMELRGIRIDKDYYEEISKQLSIRRDQLEKDVKDRYGINIASTQQVGKVFNEQFMGLSLTQTKTGRIATDVASLEQIIQKNAETEEVYILSNKVLEYRTLSKTLGTYIDKIPSVCEIKYVDGKEAECILHTDFDQIKNSGRLSSKPNIQNLPRDKKLGNVRKGFVARDGYSIVEADWSSAELRLAAIATKDERMLKLYKDDPVNADLHTLTTMGIFNKKKVTKEERYIGKTLNFSIFYGATEFAVSNLLKCSKEEARIKVDKFFKFYKGLKKWKDKVDKEIDRDRFTITFYGRKRFMPPKIHKNMREWWKCAGAHRELTNHIIQGTCADLLKFSMVKLTKEFAKRDLDAYIIANVHDSIVVEARNPEEVIPIIKQVMEVTIEDVFLPVDIEVKRNFSK